MNALVYTGPGRVELQEIPEPPVGSRECLIRVRAVGICGSDLYGFLGRSKRRVPPLVLGHEFSGEIAQIGNEVSDLRLGDTVAVYPLVACGKCTYCTTQRHQICPDRKLYGLDFHGALAEYVSVPRQCIFRLPPKMSFLEGALVEPFANSLHVLGGLREVQGQTGLIYGAGAIGSFIYLIAKHLGAKRLAVVDLNPHHLSALAELGADVVINAAESDPVNAVLKWTEGRGVDFAIDAVGRSICRQNALACTAPGATLMWFGLGEDLCEIDGRMVVTREIAIKGSYAYGLHDFVRSIALLEQKSLPVASLITEAPLSDGQKVFEELASGGSALMKVVLRL